MDKPKDYEYYRNSRNKIPYKEWPQEVKDYCNWQRRNRMNPKWKGLSDEERKKEKLKVIAQNRAKWHEKYNKMSDEEKAKVNKKKGNFWNNADEKTKEELRGKLKERSQNFWDSMTDEEKKVFGKYRWDLKSEEEKQEIIERFNTGSIEYMKNLSNEEKSKWIDMLNKARMEKMENDPDFRNKQISSLRSSCENYWNNITEEERAKIIQKEKDRWVNMSEDEKKKYSDIAVKRNHQWWASRTPEQLKEISKRMKDWNDEYWSNMENVESHSQMAIDRWNSLSEEERKSRIKVFQDFWNNLSDEEKTERMKNLYAKRKEWYESLSEEEKSIYLSRLSNAQLANWNNLSDEEKTERMKNLYAKRKEWYESLSEEEKSILIKKQLLSAIGNNKLHVKFESYFKTSYLSNEYYIRPEEVLFDKETIHSWDYGIYSKDNNKLIMVVDLDGVFFHGDNSDYNGLHSQEEYDERRFLSVPEGIKYHIINENIWKKSFELMIKMLLLDYDKFIEKQFKICRSLIDLPYPTYSDAELFKSYDQLLKLKCDDKYHQSISLNNREGDRLINHFHHSIYGAKRKDSKYSPYEAWYNDELLLKVIKNRMVYVNILNPNKILQGFNISKIAQKVSVFSAGRAKLLINKYLYNMNEIFDPFSGFSGRMLGTISLGKRYIGQDISEIHIRESMNILEFLKLIYKFDVYLEDKNILHSYGEYQSLFTCPPYSDKEQWLEVPIDKRTCDNWIYECLNRFKCKKYLFVVDNTTQYEKYIVEEIINKSHFGSNKEYVILIERS